MKVRRSRAEQREDTRRRLLDAARRVFVRRGFHGSSLDLVADEAGFTKGAVYSRFDSKADLFLALLEERIAARAEEMAAEAAAQHGTVAIGAAMGRQLGRRLQHDEAWQLAVIEFRVHAARDPVLNRRYAALHAKTRRGIATLIVREAAEVDEPAPAAVDDVARGALALAIGTVLERAVEREAFPPELSEPAFGAVPRRSAAMAITSSSIWRTLGYLKGFRALSCRNLTPTFSINSS